MKGGKELREIERIFELKYEKQQEEFQKTLLREAQLRTEISDLDRHYRESCEVNNAEFKMRSVGADVAWQAWVSRKKTHLNIELAQVLSTKERKIGQIREAFGRLLAIQDSNRERHHIKARELKERTLAQVIALTSFVNRK